MQVWQDLNQDGVSQAGELITLDAAGIQSIGVFQSTSNPAGADGGYFLDSFNGMANGGFLRRIEGNTVTHSGTVTMTDATTQEIVDVWFDHDLVPCTLSTEDPHTLDVNTLFLPTLRGYGNLADLHIAMSLDNGTGGLLDQVSAFATARTFEGLFNDFDAVRSEVRDIMMSWAGVDENAAPLYKRHGVFEEMPEFFFLRKLTGITGEFLGKLV